MTVIVTGRPNPYEAAPRCTLPAFDGASASAATGSAPPAPPTSSYDTVTASSPVMSPPVATLASSPYATSEAASPGSAPLRASMTTYSTVPSKTPDLAPVSSSSSR